MKKEELIKDLINASELEEGHTPIIAHFLIDDFNWGPIEQDKIDKIKGILNTIKIQTIQHEKMIEQIISMVQDGGEDEF
jgi:hypothetical protein